MLAMDIAAAERTVTREPLRQRLGVIALSGMTGAWAGSGELSCDAACACRVASRMLTAEYDNVDDDVLDAIAEVAGTIVGDVRNLMETGLGPIRYRHSDCRI